MAKEDRRGNRKPRQRANRFKSPELGYYLVVTDTEATERCYFTGLHESLPEAIREKLTIKVVETSTKSLIDKCKEYRAYDPQYRIPWIVFDRDRVVDFDEIIDIAKKEGINVGWSNPCFEIWLYAYFGQMPNIKESSSCCTEFARIYERKTGQKYEKSNEHLYQKLIENGDEEKAITVANQKMKQCERERKVKPSEMFPCTTVHYLIQEIKNKSKRQN